VVAHLAGAVSIPTGRIALDSLLASAVATRDGITPATVPSEIVPIEIPVAREREGRFHLASFSSGRLERREHRFINRRFPIAEAQERGNTKLKTVNITTGPGKSYRIPLENGHIEQDTLTWWCIGDRTEIEALLQLVSYVGKKRSVGLGRVREWVVEQTDPWGDGFPVVLDGLPLRPLPLDWPGIDEARAARGLSALSYPYWVQTSRVSCWLPEAA
jgi:CRISPR type IV-associated protein Csf3